jgi:hypothetical protein
MLTYRHTSKVHQTKQPSAALLLPLRLLPLLLLLLLLPTLMLMPRYHTSPASVTAAARLTWSITPVTQPNQRKAMC